MLLRVLDPMVCLWEIAVVAFYDLMLCQQTFVRRRSCMGAANLCLCGVWARALRSCGVEMRSRVPAGVVQV